MLIDYELLNRSVTYYAFHDFRRIEVPWVVSRHISDITKPANATEHVVIKRGYEKVFVASGEQSFLSLINKSFLPSGKYQAITPCMRDDNFGPYHTKYFMKNELIWFGKKVDSGMLESVRNSAFGFFSSILPENDRKYLNWVPMEDGSYDIEYKGIELGSYGIRKCPFCQWIYGTGLALPRFTMAVTDLTQ